MKCFGDRIRNCHTSQDLAERHAHAFSELAHFQWIIRHVIGLCHHINDLVVDDPCIERQHQITRIEPG